MLFKLWTSRIARLFEEMAWRYILKSAWLDDRGVWIDIVDDGIGGRVWHHCHALHLLLLTL